MIGWIRKSREMMVKKKIKKALLGQAHIAIESGGRFQFRVEEIGGTSEIKSFITDLSIMSGMNVRGNACDGLLTIYSDDDYDGTSVTVATIKR